MLSIQRFLSQGETISALLRKLREERMPHATLILGEAGIGKWTLAHAVAAALLCESRDPAGRPCGKCRTCAQMEESAAPDLIVLQKGVPLVQTEVRSRIPVADVEEMIRRISLQGFQGSRRVVIIRHAEDLWEDAQNKLLKTLEEPPEGVFFLLTCRNEELLLPTIISRCTLLKLHPWSEGEVLRALKEKGVPDARLKAAVREAGGSVGRALQIAEDESFWKFREEVMRDFLGCSRRGDILEISGRWRDRKGESDALFSILENTISELMRYSLGVEEALSVPGLPEKWKRFAQTAEPGDYTRLLDAMRQARERIHFQVSFQAVLEQVLLSMLEAISV